jgi:hypothetical protein
MASARTAWARQRVRELDAPTRTLTQRQEGAKRASLTVLMAGQGREEPTWITMTARPISAVEAMALRRKRRGR